MNDRLVATKGTKSDVEAGSIEAEGSAALRAGEQRGLGAAPATADVNPTTRPAAKLKAWSIGREAFTGTHSESGDGTVTIEDCGRGFKDKGGDSFYFLAEEIRGDGCFTARLDGGDNGLFARCGIMLRSELSPEASFIMVSRNSSQEGNRTILQTRLEEGKVTTTITASNNSVVGPLWLRLERCGDKVRAFESKDGKEWLAIGECHFPLSGLRPAYMGLASASCSPNEAGRTIAGEISSNFKTGLAVAAEPPHHVIKRDGTILAGKVLSVDESSVVLEGGVTIPKTEVSALVLAKLDSERLSAIRRLGANVSQGLVSRNGDFLESELRTVADGKATLDSILFGRKTADVDREVTAIILRGLDASPASLSVRLSDGAVLEVGVLIPKAKSGSLKQCAAEWLGIKAEEIETAVAKPPLIR